MKPRKDNCLKKRKRKEQTYLRVVQSYGEQKEHSHTSEHLDKKKEGKRERKYGFMGKEWASDSVHPFSYHSYCQDKLVEKPNFSPLHYHFIFGLGNLLGKGVLVRISVGTQSSRIAEISRNLRRNSCQSVSLSSSSRLTLANENVWRGEEEAGEERWKVCRLFIVCKLNGKCSLSLKKGGWLCLGLSHILCSVRIKSFVSYWSYGNISLGRFSPF